MRSAQNEKSDDGQNVKDEHCKNNVVKKLTVAARDTEDAGPDHRDHQRDRGSLVFGMQAGNAAEKESVLGHGVIDARARQNQTVAAAKSGNHDRDGHQSSTG